MKGDSLTFEVQGSYVYEITLEKKTKRVHVSCSCPAHGHCKHLAEIFRDARDDSIKKKTGKARVIDQKLWPQIVDFIKEMDFQPLDEINSQINEVEEQIKALKNSVSFLKQKRNELFDSPDYGIAGKGFTIKE